MAATPTTPQEFVRLLSRSQLVPAERLRSYLATVGRVNVAQLAERFVADGILTRFQVGQLLNGRWRGFFLGPYRILAPIASGGMSRVLLAEHTSLGRRVALKVTALATGSEELTRQRSAREGRAIASLDHPNVVRAFDMGFEGGVVYLAMEYVEGESLASLVARGPVALNLAADCTRQAARGLQHAHDAGWLHRDVKPSNLLLTAAGVVKVLDLGLARPLIDTGENLTQKYEPKNILGTLDFLSPEQIRRAPDVDGRSDVYGLGATFYFLLTGRPPFERGKLVEKLLWHLIEEPQPVRELRPEVPEALAAILHRMLAKDPNARFSSPGEVAEALVPWACGITIEKPARAEVRSTPTPPASTAPTKAPPPRKFAKSRLPWLLAGAVASLALAGGGYAGLLWWPRWNTRPIVVSGSEKPALSPQQAGERLGQQVTLEMQVRSVGANRKETLFFFNSEEDFRDPKNFTIVVPKAALGEANADVEELRQTYANRRVQVVGVVFLNQQQPRIEIDRLDRIRLLPQP